MAGDDRRGAASVRAGQGVTLTAWRRDLLTVLLGPSGLGAVAGAVVGAYLAVVANLHDPRAGLGAPISGLMPVGAAAGAVFALAGIPVAALAVWWVRRTGNHVGARIVTSVAGAVGPAGVMIADASSAPPEHAVATWVVAGVGTVIVVAVLWALLGRLLPRHGGGDGPRRQGRVVS